MSSRRRRCAGMLPLCLLVAAIVGAAAPSFGEPGRDTTPVLVAPAHAFTFTPRPGDETTTFLVSEATFNCLAAYDESGARYFPGHSLGLMRNFGPRWAVGGAVDVWWVDEAKVGGTLRARRWFRNDGSLELALGWVPNGATHGTSGPIASLRYAPWSFCFVQAGACRVHHEVFGPGQAYHVETPVRGFVGFGFAGPAGIAVTALEVVSLALLIATLDPMY